MPSDTLFYVPIKSCSMPVRKKRILWCIPGDPQRYPPYLADLLSSSLVEIAIELASRVIGVEMPKK